MRDKSFEEHKTSLTAAEKLRVAHAVLVWGWDDHKVAQLMNVNPGRVSEAVTAVLKAIDPEAVRAERPQRERGPRKALGSGLDRGRTDETGLPGVLHGVEAEASQRAS